LERLRYHTNGVALSGAEEMDGTFKGIDFRSASGFTGGRMVFAFAGASGQLHTRQVAQTVI
jgi:hypothetical protein